MIFDKTISSPSNALVAEWRDCLTSKGIRKHGLFIVAGERAVRETLERFPSLVRSLFVSSEGAEKFSSLIEQARSLTAASSGAGLGTGAASGKQASSPGAEARFSVIALARSIFEELDVSGTHHPLLLTRTPEIADADLSKAPEGLEVLCALGDPSNVGALLRSAAAFGASKVILLRECASPFHPKAVRAASASTLLTALERGPSIKDLPGATINGPVLALDMNGRDLGKFEWPKNARLLIGEEGPGVPSSKSFEFLSIPMAKDVESLNATVAASVALYSYYNRHR